MKWNSVVGKLWATIIGLVTIILLLLSLYLSQFIDRFYFQQESKNILELANGVAEVLRDSKNREEAYFSINRLIEGEDRNLEVILDPHAVKASPVSEILRDPRIQPAWRGENVTIRGFFPTPHNSEVAHQDFLVVAVPVKYDKHQGIVLIFESLDKVRKTTEGSKSIIIHAAIFGIVLTTVFAFFLSTRITQPLLQMKNAAVKMAEGDFDSRITIRTSDEIGELGSAFNHMAKQLYESIHLLSREKENLASILRSMADGVISVDLDMNIRITNPMAEKFLLMWQDETPTLPEPLRLMFKECIIKKEEILQDIRIKDSTLDMVVSPLYDGDQIRGAVAVFRDVTYERTLEKIRKDFVANISHELRTPLAMLQGYSEAILDGVASTPEEQEELTRIIYDESVRMSKLVNELLDLTRMEAGHIQLDLNQVDIHALLTKVLRKFRGVVREREINLSFIGINKSQFFMLDEDRMEQVLTNLIDNAIRHTPDGGEVTISTKITEQNLELIVSDTGTGISKEDLPFVFERFYKGDKARTRSRSGTGLGLSIVRNIVLAHKGHIYVESTIGEGTSFIMQIPLQQDNSN